MKRHILLVGLPGAGKSTVGQLVADGLAAPFVDIDSILVRQMGMPIAQIFGMVGEPGFRAREREAVAAALAQEPAVIVPGGGWAAQPGHMEAAKERCLIIYMKCSATTAARRSEDGEVRPLLAGADPMERSRNLLLAREQFYRLADYEVSADVKGAAVVAREVMRVARTHGGW